MTGQWEREEDGWIRATVHPIEGTTAALQRIDWRDDDGQDASVIELTGELPATPETIRAAAQALLALDSSR